MTDPSSAIPDFSAYTEEQLVDVLRMTVADGAPSGKGAAEMRVHAVCAFGDRLRFALIKALPLDAMALLVSFVENDEHGWDDLRFESAITLCEAKHPGGRALLGSLSDPRRRFDAIKALGRVADDEDVKIVLRRISGGWFVAWPDRLAASAVLSAVGDVEGGRYFENRLSSNWQFAKRALAIHLLGDVRHPRAFEQLSVLAQSGDRKERSVAIRALGHLADHRGKDVITAMRGASAHDPELQEDMRYALELLA